MVGGRDTGILTAVVEETDMALKEHLADFRHVQCSHTSDTAILLLGVCT